MNRTQEALLAELVQRLGARTADEPDDDLELRVIRDDADAPQTVGEPH